MTMSKIARKKLFVDESRIWNLEEPAAGATSNKDMKITSILVGYMWYDIHVESMLNIRRSSRNLASMGITGKKNNFLEYLVDTFIGIKKWKIIFIAYDHGKGQFYFQL